MVCISHIVDGNVNLMWNKIGCFSDIHFGEHGNSEQHNLQCLDFIDWFIEQSADCDVLLFGGDWHHHRTNVGAGTLMYSYEGVRRLAATGKEIWFIIGNHDLPDYDRRANHSVPWVHSFKNIRVIDTPQTVGNFLLVPWLTMGDDLDKLKKSPADYAFGHFEFGGFVMNEAYNMPFRTDHLQADDLQKFAYVFAGHFHKRQSRKLKSGTIVDYIGNPFPHSFSDVGDRDRGMMVLTNGGKPEYRNWPAMPTFDRILASKIDEALPLLSKRSTVEVILDIEMGPTERDKLRQYLSEEVGVHSAAITPLKLDVTTIDVTALAASLGGNESVCEVVTTFLGEIVPVPGSDAFGLDPVRLQTIFNGAQVL